MSMFNVYRQGTEEFVRVDGFNHHDAALKAAHDIDARKFQVFNLDDRSAPVTIDLDQ